MPGFAKSRFLLIDFNGEYTQAFDDSKRVYRLSTRVDTGDSIPVSYTHLAGPAIRNAMMDLISAAFATFEQRMQSDKDGIPMERIYLDDLLPGEDYMQRSDLVADPYASNPEKIMEKAENRKELYEGLRRISERERVYLLYRFGFEDDMEHPLVGTALHFHLSESRARSTEALALDNLWLELPWWY